MENVQSAFDGFIGSIGGMSESLADVDTGILTNVVSLLPQLVNQFQVIASIDTSNMENVQSAFDGFIGSIGGMSVDSAAISSTATAINQLVPALLALSTLENFNFKGLTQIFTSFSTISVQGMIEGFTVGFQQLTLMMQTQAMTMCMTLQTVFMAQTPIFMTVSAQWGQNMVQGLSSKQGAVRGAATTIGTSAVNALNLIVPQFKTAGQNAGQGFVDGILEYVEKAAEAAAQVAQAAIDSMNQTLDSHSPSKKMIQSGEWGGEGFTIGLLNLVSSAKNAGSKLAEGALNSITDAIGRARDALENTEATQPTIRPVVDLSDVSNKARAINQTFSANRRFSVGVTASKVASASSGFSSGQNGFPDASGANGGSSKVNSINFIQNNYSPKALSRSEIYRDTSNQFSMLKEAVFAK